ncbi:hypothetical protein [Arthrobacter sp. ISL-30]|uniref:hypothetical protein n=1 Tax=Arthrobacter sp. ISL-30 TaxID=2819109 RepID=UPI0035B17A3C
MPTASAVPRHEMQGGTTFNFMTDGIESALAQAREAAAGKDVAIAGGAETVRQYLTAALIDELRLTSHPSSSLRASGSWTASTTSTLSRRK